MAQTSFSNWDFRNLHVEEGTGSNGVNGSTFVSAETTLIAAGPANLMSDPKNVQTTTPMTTDVYPIGLLESFGLQQNKQLQRIFEIGSSRSYFIPGRVIGSLALGRTWYSGANLLRALYGSMAFDNKDTNNNIKSLVTNSTTKSSYQIKRSPGFNDDKFFIDLASDMFSQPTGMAIYFKNYAGESVGSFYLQECYIQGHQLNISSGSVLIMDGAQLQYDTLVPVKMGVAGTTQA